jgi:hypothetical protein
LPIFENEEFAMKRSRRTVINALLLSTLLATLFFLGPRQPVAASVNSQGGTGPLCGRVTLQGRQDNQFQGTSVSLYEFPCWQAVQPAPITVLTDQRGCFEIPLPGERDYQCLTVYQEKYLTGQRDLDPGFSGHLGVIELPGGDTDGNNVVDIFDLVRVIISMPPAPYDPNADINGDGRVDVLDLVLVASNFDRAGSVAWWDPDDGVCACPESVEDEGPVIDFFRVDRAVVAPGEFIWLWWQSTGATEATLCRLEGEECDPNETWIFAPNDGRNYFVPRDRVGEERFRLVVRDASGRSSDPDEVEVQIVPPIPFINSFDADVDEAAPGDVITLEWQTTGGVRARLNHLSVTDQVDQTWAVALNDTMDYTIPADSLGMERFEFYVFDDEEEQDFAEVEVTVVQRCHFPWFFVPPPPTECPIEAATVTDGAEQHFERGTMLWVSSEDRIYVLYEDALLPSWQIYVDEWEEGNMPLVDPGPEPPHGVQKPVRGLGWIWLTKPGVSDRLGWAVDGEQGYQTAIQRSVSATYIRALDGGVWMLEPGNNDWSYFP